MRQATTLVTLTEDTWSQKESKMIKFEEKKEVSFQLESL